MERVQICKYVKNYSKIEKIQDEYEVDYSADITENNIFLSVVHIQNPNNYYVKCLCENVSEKQAKNPASPDAEASFCIRPNTPDAAAITKI